MLNIYVYINKILILLFCIFTFAVVNIQINVMKKIKTDSKALSSYLANLTPNEKRITLDKLEDGCKVPRYTLYNWARGLARIPELHKSKIEEIIGCKIFVDVL